MFAASGSAINAHRVTGPTAWRWSAPGRVALPKSGDPNVSRNESLVVPVPEAAALLGVSEGLIYQLLDKGLLPELPRWSRRRLIPRRAVDDIIERPLSDYEPDIVLRTALS